MNFKWHIIAQRATKKLKRVCVGWHALREEQYYEKLFVKQRVE